MTARLATVRKEHEDLVSERKAVEDAYYNFATTECDMEEDVTKSKITKARLKPQKNARLQSIHVIHQAVLLKEAAITDAEGELAACEAQCTKDEKPVGADARTPKQHDDKVIANAVISTRLQDHAHEFSRFAMCVWRIELWRYEGLVLFPA